MKSVEHQGPGSQPQSLAGPTEKQLPGSGWPSFSVADPGGGSHFAVGVPPLPTNASSSHSSPTPNLPNLQQPEISPDVSERLLGTEAKFLPVENQRTRLVSVLHRRVF